MPWHNCMTVLINAPLPKDKHLGILPQRKAEETSCGQISQLNICQLLSAGPQVVYPSGLNGHDEPIITTLPEPLSSGISIIASKHPYLEIDIPPKEDSDAKAPPIGKASIIQTTNPHKSPLKLEGSMTTEVNDLLDQAIMEVSSCESEHSSIGKITTAAVNMTPPWKSEVSVPPIDMSSQASIEDAEGSPEDIPANISLIAAVYSSRSQCQQSHQQYASPQEVPRHQEAKSHLGTGGVVTSKQISGDCISHCSQDRLFPVSPGGQNQFLSSSHGGQDNQVPFNSSSWGGLFKSHQWSQSPENFPGCDVPGGTWQIHAELRGASLREGKPKLSWGPLLPSGCPVPQSTAT